MATAAAPATATGAASPAAAATDQPSVDRRSMLERDKERFTWVVEAAFRWGVPKSPADEKFFA